MVISFIFSYLESFFVVFFLSFFFFLYSGASARDKLNYAAEARREDGPYTDSHSDHSDWKVNVHSVGFLYPSATVVNDIEGTLYVTCSLVLPSTYMVILKARKPNVVAPWDEAVVFTRADMTREVVLAHRSVCDALQDRFIASLPAHVL